MIQYGANLYRRGEMNMVKRMQNILSINPQPDIVQLLTWVCFVQSNMTCRS